MARRFVLLWLLLLLSGCSAERRHTREYLAKLDATVMPAVQQAHVIEELGKNLKGGGFVAGWPVMRKNLEELQAKVETASQSLPQLPPPPPPAAALHQLVTDEVAVVKDWAARSISVGDQVVAAGKGLAALRKLAQLGPDLEELKRLQLRHVELSTKIQTELQNIKTKERL